MRTRNGSSRRDAAKPSADVAHECSIFESMLTRGEWWSGEWPELQENRRDIQK